jgi:hypothetical protein
MTFGKILRDHQAQFQRTSKSPPAEFTSLWNWTQQHGFVLQN